MVVTRAAFDEAVVCGDLPTAQAFFAQPHVRSLLLSTNACILETEPTDPAAFRLPNGAYPWYCRPKHSPVDNDDIPLLSAARNGHAHVVEWLFSLEHALFMGETLAFLLPLVAQYDSKREWHHAPWTSDPLVLETLLSSRVFCDWVADHKKQSILDDIAGQCVSPAVIAIAVSHGARLHSARTVVALYGIPALRTTMAGLVSPNVLLAPSCYWESVNASDSFLTIDVDDSGPGDALIHTAGSGDDDALQRLLCDGVLDVDVRDRDGKTALMHVACVDPTTDLGPHVREDRTREIAEQLCQYSDVDSVDADGWTALHYATDAANRQVANVLLASGADVSLYDHQGLVAHDYLSDTELEAAVEPYLQRGANPFWSFRREHRSWDRDDEAAQPTCLYGRLLATPSGRDFIQSNPRYFERVGPAENSC
jgi:hypothetical protein